MGEGHNFTHQRIDNFFMTCDLLIIKRYPALKTGNVSELDKTGYIWGIEGLRGVAVIAVIINHLNNEYLPGGYLGVDVFFVISGFVISDLLKKQKLNSIYTYILTFYTRRIRRLFPALLVFIIITTVISSFFPFGFGVTIIRTGASALLGLSNLYQIRIGNDYFGLGSKFNLFTHTWSLGVEEQFYLIFPLILYVLKRKNLNVTTFLVLTSLMSFLTFTIFFYYEKNILQYYLPISRFWEILIGAITYSITKNINLHKYFYDNKWHMNVYLLSLLGCFFIPSEFFIYSAPTVCIFTALFLYGVRIHGYKYIETPFLLFTGKISYSLYLYHILVLILLNLEPNVFSIFVQFFFIYVISFLSYKFIEKPFRFGKGSQVGLSTIYVFGLVSISTALLIFGVSRDLGTRDPFSDPIEKNFATCTYNNIDDSRCLLKSEQNKQLFFIGDSHSNALLPLMVRLHERLSYQIYSVGLGGLYTTEFTSSNHGDLSERGKKVLKFIESKGRSGDVVILTNQLMTWFSKTYNDKQKDHRLFLNDTQLIQPLALKIHTRNIGQLAKNLDIAGMSLVVLAPFPDFKYDPSTCFSPVLFKFFKDYKTSDNCETTRKDQEVRRNHILESLKNLLDKNKNVFIFDPIDFICDENSCSSFKKNVPLYYDDDHINFNTALNMYLQFKNLLDLTTFP